MVSPPAPDPSAAVSVDLVDALLESVAGVIHDRPVQQLVAATLMLETSGTADDVLEQRGMAALTAAGDQARQIMWALTRPEIRPDCVAEDLERSLSHAGPAEAPRVTVDLGDTPPDHVTALLEALHDVAVDVVLGGHRVVAVGVTVDAEGAEAHVESTGDRPPGPWVQLARARLAAVEGQVTQDDDAGRARRRLVLRVPG